MEDKTIISIEQSGNKFSGELSWDASIGDLLDAFFGLCVCLTYHPKSIEKEMVEYLQDKGYSVDKVEDEN